MGTEKKYALILAGGKSSRMGIDKAVLNVGGSTMLERAIHFWRESGKVEHILVAIGQAGHLEPLPDGIQGIPDKIQGRGPMAGIWSAFTDTDADLLYVSAVDMPNLSADNILPEPKGDAIVYRREGRPEPLFGIYRRSVAAYAEKLLASGEGKMRLLLERVDTEYVDMDKNQLAVFENMNTPRDLLRARAGNPPMIAVTGWHNSGKTTFLEGLIPILRNHEIRIAVIKHDVHGFNMDQEGTDTRRLADAGSETTAIIGPGHWALLGTGEPTLEEIRSKIPETDLIIAEGFKRSTLPKIEIHRKEIGQPLIVMDDTLMALVTDEDLETSAPKYTLEDYEAVADLIISELGL